MTMLICVLIYLILVLFVYNCNRKFGNIDIKKEPFSFDMQIFVGKEQLKLANWQTIVLIVFLILPFAFVVTIGFVFLILFVSIALVSVVIPFCMLVYLFKTMNRG